MKTDVNSQKLTENQTVFLDYVERMPHTTGQRFIKKLIELEGFNGFDDFMRRLHQTRNQDDAEVVLTQPEKAALAHALHGRTRRSFLAIGAGVGMILAAGAMGKSAISNIRDGEPISGEKVCKIGAKGFGATLSTVVGLCTIYDQTRDPVKGQIDSIASGANGRVNVEKLVKALDKLIKPIEVSLQESGAERSR